MHGIAFITQYYYLILLFFCCFVFYKAKALEPVQQLLALDLT